MSKGLDNFKKYIFGVDPAKKDADIDAVTAVTINTKGDPSLMLSSTANTPSLTIGNTTPYTTAGPLSIGIASDSCSSTPGYYNPGSFTTVGTTFTFPGGQEMDCKLPEDLLKKMTLLGMANSKDLLKTKIKEAYKYWLETQKIKYETFPVLLVAAMLILGVNVDLVKEMEKEEKEKEEKIKKEDK